MQALNYEATNECGSIESCVPGSSGDASLHPFTLLLYYPPYPDNVLYTLFPLHSPLPLLSPPPFPPLVVVVALSLAFASTAPPHPDPLFNS